LAISNCFGIPNPSTVYGRMDCWCCKKSFLIPEGGFTDYKGIKKETKEGRRRLKILLKKRGLIFLWCFLIYLNL